MIAPSTPTDRSRVTRWPAIILLAAAIALMVIADGGRDSVADSAALERPIVPTAGRADALSSAWYCAAGTIVEDGPADHTLVIANPASVEAQVQLTVFAVLAPQPLELDLEAEDIAEELELVPPEAFDLGSTAATVTVPARSVERIRVADIEGVGGEHAAVLVESDVGQMLVEHIVTGSAGSGLGACASTSADAWYFAAGTTRKDTREILSVFNPFPGDAVVDLTFTADGTLRAPQIYEGLVVPSGTVLPIDITDVVTLFDSVSARLEVRTGRVAADRLLLVETEEGIRGLSVAPGSPAASDIWAFASSARPGTIDAIAITNPTETDAEVELEVRLDLPEFNGTVEPIRVAVRSLRSVVVVLQGDDEQIGTASVVDAEGRILDDVGYWVTVRSLDGVPVVADHLTWATGTETTAAASAGAPLAASEHLMTTGDGRGEIAVVNPAGDRLVRIDIEASFAGQRFVVATEEVPQTGRVVLDLESLGLPADALVTLVASDPVVVERRLVIGDGGEVTAASVPVAGTTTDLDIPFG